jgi:dihydrofolate reductase
MRKLKLQVQISVDGFIADNNGKTDWMIWNWGPQWTWDNELQKYFEDLTASIDCVLLSRKMAVEGFIDHWAKMADSKNSQSAFAKKIADAHKVVFSKTIKKSKWDNAEIAGGNLKTEINKIKKQKGKDIIVYGGASFLSSLIKTNLIDEFHLFVNPTALGSGMPIFKEAGKLSLDLVNAKSYSCGIAVLIYEPKK